MSFVQTDEQIMLREAVGKVAAEFGHAYFLDRSRTGAKLDELWSTIGRNGYVGVSLPEQYGGGGMGVSELVIVCEELAAHGCPLLFLIVSPAICGSIIAAHGTDVQRAAWLPGIASGANKMAFAITEPDAGSNSHRISTVARRDGDDWILNGTKYYISGIDESAQVLVVARTGVDDATGKGRLSLFIVDTDSIRTDLIPVEITSTEKQFTLYFDEVRVPGDRLVGREGDGLRQVFTGLNPERITGAACANGLGVYALAKASAYARDRKVWDVPIGAHQGISHPLAQSKIELELARLMTSKAAWLYDHGEDAGEAANMAKYAAAEAALACLDNAIQTHGGNGMATEFGLSTMWGMARLLRIAPVSREMILNFVAQHSLQLPKSY